MQAKHCVPALRSTARRGNSEADHLIAAYSEKLQHSLLPKLLLYALPGFVATMESIVWARKHLPALEVVDIGEALHFAQEVSPALMGESISVWLQALEQTTGRASR